MRRVFHLIIMMLFLASEAAANGVGNTNCPVVRIEAERLPDMTVPRSGHSALMLNGELTVVGGHTSGFVLTQTAEYLKDGEWHSLNTVYMHDGGLSIVLKSGKVMLAGGFKDNLGIGQSYEVEIYDPLLHTFKGFGCLDQKRVSGAAVELDGGRVMIVGNWYADDGIELFDGKGTFSHVRNVSQTRCLPHVFRTSDGDAVIVSGYDYHGEQIESIIVDRLYGAPFSNEIFDSWKPLKYDLVQHGDDSFIGDVSKGDYRYLMPVENRDGQVAIIEVRDTVFTPLPTTCPVPMKSQWGPVKYVTPVYADRKHHRGYVVGSDDTNRLYSLCIDYSKTPASLTLYHTDPLPEAGMRPIPVLTPEGNLILTGGISNVLNSNFSPTAAVWLLRFYDEGRESAGVNWWLCGIGAMLLLMAILAVYLLSRRKHRQAAEQPEEPSLPARGDAMLMQRICELMEGQQIYLQQGLKVSDVASLLSTNSRYVSECIRAEKGCSFTLFVSEYRLEHAKRLLLESPDKKMSTVAIESGFSNDKALTRCFKDMTGLTPTDWKTQNLNTQKQ